jgi:CheY-like chemotaxis protein
MSLTHQPRLPYFYAFLHRYNPSLTLLMRMLRFSIVTDSVRSLRHIVLLAMVAAGRDLRVLLADDDADDRDFFTDAVRESAPGVKVDTVVNGEQLLHRLSNGNPLPDIIFLDLNMPVKDGHECLSEIRSDDKLRHIPIIIYSTSSSREHIDHTYESGASLYVRKPDSFTDLKSIAKKILAQDWHNYQRPAKEKFYLTAKSI